MTLTLHYFVMYILFFWIFNISKFKNSEKHWWLSYRAQNNWYWYAQVGYHLHSDKLNRLVVAFFLTSNSTLYCSHSMLNHIIILKHSATNSPSSDQGSTAVATGHRDMAWNILSTYGPTLTVSLMNVISSEAPGYAVDARNGSAGSILWRLRFLCQDLQKWVQDAFQVCRRPSLF